MSAIEKSGPARYRIPSASGDAEVRTRPIETNHRGNLLVVETINGSQSVPTAASPDAAMLTSLNREGVKALLQACVDFLVMS